MTVELSLSIGIFAALFMFSGDMFLYYTTENYTSDGTFNPVINVMKKISNWRLMLGGIIGPIAAFFYCIGFYHMVLISTEKYKILSFIAFLLCALGIIIGGAYHSHCTYLGLLTKRKNSIDENMIRYIKVLSGVSFLFLGVGLLISSCLILFGQTQYLRSFFLLTPIVLYFLKFLWKKLPSPFSIVIYGGWSNLMFAIYFIGALILS